MTDSSDIQRKFDFSPIDLSLFPSKEISLFSSYSSKNQNHRAKKVPLGNNNFNNPNKQLEDFPFNNHNELISTLIISKLESPNVNTVDNTIILEALITNCFVEKSDSIKIEYLLFFNENLHWFITPDFKKHEFLIKNLFELLKESLVSTNYLLKFHLIRTLTNLMLYLDLKTLYPEFFFTFKSFLLTSLQDKTMLRALRYLIAQSLLELESFYPGILDNDFILESEGVGVKPFETKNSSLFSYKHRMPQAKESMVSDVSGLINALSLRNYSLVGHYPYKNLDNSLNQISLLSEKDKALNLLDLYKAEKSQLWAFELMLLVEICENQLKSQKETFQELPGKTLQLVKKVISHIITDLNNLNYFTQIFIHEKLNFFLNIWKMTPKVLLPLFMSMLKLQGNLYVLTNLLILELYYEDFDEGFLQEFIQRLFYDVNDESLSIEEKCLMIYWIMNLKSFAKENNIFKEKKKWKFHKLLTDNLEDLLPKPQDNYILKEKKILAYLSFESAIMKASPEKIISILQNFQIFKNFSIISDITSLFFRILYDCIKHLPFEEYVKDLSDFMFEIIQHKPKFALNLIELFSKLKATVKDTVVPAFLTGFSQFLKKLEPSICINKYFDLIYYTIQEPSVSPNDVLISLFRLIQTQDLEVLSSHEIYISNENVLFLCKEILKNYSFEIVYPFLNKIFSFLAQNSTDFSFKDTSKIYLMLLNNLNEKKLEKIFFKYPKKSSLIFSYNPGSHCQIQENIGLKFEISTKERKELGIKDFASSIFGDLSMFFPKKNVKSRNFFKSFLSMDSFANAFTLLEDEEFLKTKPFGFSQEDFNFVLQDKSKESNQKTILNEPENFIIVEKELETSYFQELKLLKLHDMKEILTFSAKFFNFLSTKDKIRDFETFIFCLFYTEFNHNPPFITLPMNLSLTKPNEIFYSLMILFAESENYEEIPNLFIPFLGNAGDHHIFYKVLLKIFIKNPVPMRISTGFFFTKNDEQIALALGTQIDLRFEDMFLPLKISKQVCEEISSAYNLEFNDNEENLFKEFLKLILFEYIWNNGIKQENKEIQTCVESAKLLNNTRKKILQKNSDYLSHFWIHEPYCVKQNDEALKQEDKTILDEILLKINRDISEFDFEFEKELENNKQKIFQNDIYYSSVMMILPEKYIVLCKIMIHESCTLVRIKTNTWKSLKHIDSFFEKWNEK